MRRSDAILIVQMHHDANRGGFLASIKVDEAWNPTAREFDVQPFLELTNRFHHTVGFE
jgi:hypothetical protein